AGVRNFGPPPPPAPPGAGADPLFFKKFHSHINQTGERPTRQKKKKKTPRVYVRYKQKILLFLTGANKKPTRAFVFLF
ncbi:hypothetical protein, partial [Enterobacter asburiae]